MSGGKVFLRNIARGDTPVIGRAFKRDTCRGEIVIMKIQLKGNSVCNTENELGNIGKKNE